MKKSGILPKFCRKNYKSIPYPGTDMGKKQVKRRVEENFKIGQQIQFINKVWRNN